VSELHARFALERVGFALDVDFQVPGRGVTAVFGPSGSGKTTLLRCVAGLERPRVGSFRVNGAVWQDESETFVPAHRRPIGYVFQEASLFTHLSVRGNLEFGHRRVPRAERKVELATVIDWLGLAALLERGTTGLSGGERQRVAIARALATSPRLLLMDEPLASLDEASRREILPYLERLHEELEIPVLYVSHSLREVARLADHMLWLERGRVRGSGPLNELLARLDPSADPEDDTMAVLEARVAVHDVEFELTALESPCGRLWVPRLERPPGARVRVRILARDVSLSLDEEKRSSILNCFATRVLEIADSGPGQVLVYLACGDEPHDPRLLARITRKSCSLIGLQPGARVFARVKGVSLVE